MHFYKTGFFFIYVKTSELRNGFYRVIRSILLSPIQIFSFIPLNSVCELLVTFIYRVLVWTFHKRIWRGYLAKIFMINQCNAQGPNAFFSNGSKFWPKIKMDLSFQLALVLIQNRIEFLEKWCSQTQFNIKTETKIFKKSYLCVFVYIFKIVLDFGFTFSDHFIQ